MEKVRDLQNLVRSLCGEGASFSPTQIRQIGNAAELLQNLALRASRGRETSVVLVDDGTVTCELLPSNEPAVVVTGDGVAVRPLGK